MDKHYDHKKIEAKWQKVWEKEAVFVASEEATKPKYYALCMFPYPSAAGLHVGHPESYTAVDIIARYKHHQGYNVLNPIGWDAFGLPAENYAIKVGIPPWQTTADSIANFRRQIKSFGFAYDWSREVNTSDPEYYQWTQWMFLQMYKHGLAYKKKAKVNWCENCQTVLANEQVVDGRCERCQNDVQQKDLEQWFFKITDYAEELLQGLDDLDWPEHIKTAQKNWIGKSEGAALRFKIKDLRLKNGEEAYIDVFTTRPDTLFGATYVVLAPEHVLVKNLESRILNLDEVQKYIQLTKKKSDLERTNLNKEKTGVELQGVKAINPANGKEIPIFIADYVLSTYGTGAIMAVPAHDERDWEFAQKYNLEILEVIRPLDKLTNQKSKIKNQNEKSVFTDNGCLINSGEFDGLDSEVAKEKITNKVGGKMKVQYRLRDWLVSRQRYWGAPIPIIYCKHCGVIPVPEKDLPVVLPQDVDFKPTGQSPLISSKKFHQVVCPQCGAKGDDVRREVDTMDTFVCSSWYFLRYCDPHNISQVFSKEKIATWLPVDIYIGGAEHAVLHLLYARFFTKALRDFAYLQIDEPFMKLRNQGMILGEDNQKMSKSRGNVINPDEVVAEYGADTMRVYEMFMGPLEDAKPWSTSSIIGARRFLEKIWLVVAEWLTNNQPTNESKVLKKLFHQTIKKVSEDIEAIKFNTAISALMILVNFMAKEKSFTKKSLTDLLVILNPFAPHLAEELWEKIGNQGLVAKQPWPTWDKNLVQAEIVNVAIQVNGKLRGSIEVKVDTKQAEVLLLAREQENIKKYLAGKKIVKEIYVPGKIVNIVVK